jgi:Fur family ferric uptake transcriptional regulator
MSNQNEELKKAGLKATLPRIKIMEVLASTAIQEEAHFSAEDIYKELISKDEDIGLATIYRVLTQFEAAGMVTKHHFENSKAVYEINSNEHHDHMVDVDTGKVMEFHDEELEKLQHEIANKKGYELVDHSMILHVRKIES